MIKYWKKDGVLFTSQGEIVVDGIELTQAVYEYELEKSELAAKSSFDEIVASVRNDVVVREDKKKAILLKLGLSEDELELFL